MPQFVEPLRAFLDEVLGDDLFRLRVMEPAAPDEDVFYRDLHHYRRDDDVPIDEGQNCMGREVLQERWTGESSGEGGGVEYAVYSYEDAELVLVFEGDHRATAVEFAAGTADDISAFADHVHDIVATESSLSD